MIVLVQDWNPGAVTPANIVAYRGWYGIATPDQIHRVIDLRDQLVAAHAGIVELFGDPEGDFAEALDGIETGITTLDTIIAPTAEAIAEVLFVDPDDQEEDEEL